MSNSQAYICLSPYNQILSRLETEIPQVTIEELVPPLLLCNSLNGQMTIAEA